jgi:hypothetical protein
MALIGVAVLLLAGCVYGGTVTRKSYVPSESRVECMHIGSNPCFPMTVEDPECWQLVLQQGGDTGEVCVDPKVWDQTQVGQHYQDPGNSR